MSLDVSLIVTECPTCGRSEEVFDGNITHNLNTMAKEAGVYDAMWNPEKIGATEANQLISILAQGLNNLVSNPAKFRKMNPENGWGTYDGLVEFVTKYLVACQDHPTAIIEVSK